jgi:dTDP-4-amino-4,6-dideoxygalactose transaminase
MEITFLDLKKAYLELKSELDAIWQEVNSRASYILGEKLALFEKEFAIYSGVVHGVGVANGLDALVLALKVLGVGPGHEVIVPSHTYIASWLAVSAVGAIPVPVDVEESTYLVDTSLIEDRLTEHTRVIMPVHLYGRVCKMNAINALAKKYNLWVLEDAAQAHGAFYMPEENSPQDQTLLPLKRAGSLGDIAGFSFYPGKNLGCFGDGGFVTTHNEKWAEEIRLLRNYGSTQRYHHRSIGGNSRLDELQAGILSVKLKILDVWNRKRQDLARLYLEQLKNIKEIQLPLKDSWTLDQDKLLGCNVWHIFPIRLKKRQELQNFLKHAGIETHIHYPIAIHHQEAYQNYKHLSMPVAEAIAREELSLPMGPHLTEKEVLYCCQIIKNFFVLG